MAEFAEEVRDGRHERSERSRLAIVKAALALVRETGVAPSGDEIAERAGLSRRTVFRLFHDMESLNAAATEHQQAEVVRRFPPPMDADRPLDQRIAAVVKHRAGVYELIMPMRRVAESMRHESPSVARNLEATRDGFRMHLEFIFGDALTGLASSELEAVLQTLELITSWHGWRALRDDQKCSAKKAARVMETGVRRLLLGG